MALGRFVAKGTISANADTSVIAAPGAFQRIYVIYMTFTVSVGGTTSRLRVEDGVGGAVFARMATVTADNLLSVNYSTAFRDQPGRHLPENTAMNVNTSGAAAATVDYDILYEVKG